MFGGVSSQNVRHLTRNPKLDDLKKTNPQERNLPDKRPGPWDEIKPQRTYLG